MAPRLTLGQRKCAQFAWLGFTHGPIWLDVVTGVCATLCVVVTVESVRSYTLTVTMKGILRLASERRAVIQNGRNSGFITDGVNGVKANGTRTLEARLVGLLAVLTPRLTHGHIFRARFAWFTHGPIYLGECTGICTTLLFVVEPPREFVRSRRATVT